MDHPLQIIEGVVDQLIFTSKLLNWRARTKFKSFIVLRGQHWYQLASVGIQYLKKLVKIHVNCQIFWCMFLAKRVILIMELLISRPTLQELQGSIPEPNCVGFC